MYVQQRGFLVDAKNFAIKKASKSSSELPQDICQIVIKMSHIVSISDNNSKNRIAEELSAQGLIQLERKNNQKIKSFNLTEQGLV